MELAIVVETKQCSKCGEVYPATTEFFPVYKKGRGGFFSWCLACDREKAKEYRRKHRKERMEQSKAWHQNNRSRVIEYQRKYRKENRELLNKWRREASHRDRIVWRDLVREMGLDKCIKCGYNESFAAIDFHHVDPKMKEAKLAYIIALKPTMERIAQFKKEVSKCIPLCSNCHRELHWGAKWDET